VFLLADGRRVDLTQGWGPARRDLAAGAPKLVPIVAKEPAPGATPAKATANDLAVKPVNASGGTSVAVKSAALVTGEHQSCAAESQGAIQRRDLDPTGQVPAPGAWGACSVFTTVLGPEANDIHRTHLHLDPQDRHSLNVCK